MRALAALIATLLVVPFGVSAQTIPSFENISLTISPTYPRPYENVTVTISSGNINVVGSTVTFYANGEVVGEGDRSATFSVGGPGARTLVRAVITAPSGTYERQLSIYPAEVSLVTESLTTTHPFYKGGSLPTAESRVRLVALADIRTSPGTRVSSDNLVYTWKLGEKLLEAQSGVGKSVFVATAPERYRDATVSVTVTTRDESRVAYAQTVVAPVEPVVRIYQADPLLGPAFSKALSGTFSLMGTESTFRVVPYFFKEQPQLSWTINNTASGERDELTVRSTGGAGSALIGATAEEGYLQDSADVTVRFGGVSRGLFGL